MTEVRAVKDHRLPAPTVVATRIFACRVRQCGRRLLSAGGARRRPVGASRPVV